MLMRCRRSAPHHGRLLGTVLALVVLLWPTKWRWLTLSGGALFVVLVSLSRVYLGVHYPSDILAGWCAAGAWVFGTSLILYGHIIKPHAVLEPFTRL